MNNPFLTIYRVSNHAFIYTKNKKSNLSSGSPKYWFTCQEIKQFIQKTYNTIQEKSVIQKNTFSFITDLCENS